MEQSENFKKVDQLALFKSIKQVLYPKGGNEWKKYFLRLRSLAFPLA